MAGGMSKRGSWGPMTDRVNPASESEPPTIRHCWVTDSHGRLPALLLEWRRREDGWHGRVVRPAIEHGEWLVVEEWLPAAMLEPA